MTVIAVVQNNKQIAIAADRLTTSGGTKYFMKKISLLPYGKGAAAMAGSLAIGQKMVEVLINCCEYEDVIGAFRQFFTEKEPEASTTVVAVIDGICYTLDSDGAIIPHFGDVAFGAGGEIALGYLEAKTKGPVDARAEAACLAACSRSILCEAPIDVLVFKRSREVENAL